MSGFFVDLWESIFQPGTTPTLIVATHLSFIGLFTVLGWLIYVTKAKNVHFIMLLLIALCLWFTIIWFINELENVKLKSNEELFAAVETDKQDASEKVAQKKPKKQD